MKALLSLGVILLAGASQLSTADANTFSGQACVSKTSGVQLVYDSTSARNPSTSTINVTCPAPRLKDDGNAPAFAVFYFNNDGTSKTCFFDNFNIGTGTLGVWTSATGTGRLDFPALNTVAWQPFTFNCSAPANARMTGYFIFE